jgi:outer membrane protein TolC
MSLDRVLMETLLKDPQIEISKINIKQDSATVQQARSIFDPKLMASLSSSKEYSPYPYAIRALAGIGRKIVLSTQYTLAMNQLFASGFEFTPSITVSKSDTEEIDTIAPYYTGKVNFSFKMPLLQGRGAKAVTAQERAAYKQVEASRHSLLHLVSEKLYSVTVAYWNFLGAKKRLDLAIETEKRAEKLFEENQRLIEAGERPAAEINQLEAFLSDKRSSRASAEQSYQEARQSAAIAMGKQRIREIENLASPSDEFPHPDNEKKENSKMVSPKIIKKALNALADTTENYAYSMAAQAMESSNSGKGIIFPEDIKKDLYIQMGLGMRQDLKNIEKQLEAAQFSLDNALDKIKPDLDFKVDLGYNAIEQGHTTRYYFDDALTNGISGINAAASLNYSWNTYNNFNKGTLTQARTNIDMLKLSVMDKKRQIQSSISIAISNLDTAVEVVKKAEITIQAYSLALENEKKKALLGMATVLDVMNTQDRYTNSLSILISAKQNYASAIARLRYETGTIFKRGADENKIEFNEMDRIPGLLVDTVSVKSSKDPEATVRDYINRMLPFVDEGIIPRLKF